MSEYEDNQRLARIEVKVDTLTDAIGKLAVVDARLSDFIQMNSRISVRISDLENKTADLATMNAVQELKLNTLVKITWTIASTVALAVLGAILKGIGLI